MDQAIHILVVDDQEVNLSLLESMLKDSGVEVVTARSGKEALAQLAKYDFALILLDIVMPGMDGFETAECIRADPSSVHIPIIFITAFGTEKKHILRGYEAGAVDYIFKPVEPKTLRSKVAVFSDLYKAKREAESEKRTLEATLRSIGDGVIAIDSESVITFMNSVAESLCGFAEEEAVGCHVSTILHMIEADGPSVSIDILVLQKLFISDFTKVEVVLRGAGDRNVPIELCMAPIIDSSGKSLGMIITFHEITRRKEAEREREELQRKLRQALKMEAIGTLAGGIAHDFNNILTPILGYAELTLDRLGEDSGLRHNLTELLKAANRAKDLVRQILTFSRQQERVFSSVQIQPIVKETLKLLRSTLPSTIEIQSDIDPDCAAILAEPTQIHQVVMNICTNAYHAMGDSQGLLKVALSQESLNSKGAGSRFGLEAGDYVKLTVSDTGEGISKDLLDRIFEPYFTTKGVGAGTGMGLAVVHSIVEEHKGAIFVDSVVGKGTRFDVYFPVSSDLSETEMLNEENKVPYGQGRILILDDEEQIARLLGNIVESLGYTPTRFTSSHEALRQFSSAPHTYDLIITDQTMPRMTGVEFSEKVHSVRPDIPIVLCSGFSKVVNEKNAAVLGVTYLSKPVSKTVLAVTLHNLLAKNVEKKNRL